MRVIIYTRVSTAEQTVDNQLAVLQRWVTDHGHELVEVYSENESAWKSGRQHELARIFKDLPRRNVDICLVWALDRLSREGSLTILTLIERFKQYGCKVESLQEPFTALPYGFDSVVYSFFGWVAKMESLRRSERTKAGLDRARAEGKTLGRPKGSKDKGKRKTTGYHLRFANPKTREKYGGR